MDIIRKKFKDLIIQAMLEISHKIVDPIQQRSINQGLESIYKYIENSEIDFQFFIDVNKKIHILIVNHLSQEQVLVPLIKSLSIEFDNLQKDWSPIYNQKICEEKETNGKLGAAQDSSYANFFHRAESRQGQQHKTKAEQDECRQNNELILS